MTDLLLTPLRPQDADEMASVLADPRLYAFIGGGPPSVDGLRRRYEAQVSGCSPDGSQRWFNWIVRHGDEAVGYVQATVVGSTAEVAWVIGVPWQGRGHATRAAHLMREELDSLGVSHLEAAIAAGHRASEIVAERLGLHLTPQVRDGERVWSDL